MNLGVHIGYWGLGLSSEDQLKIVQEAERLGYDSVWTAEAYGSDAATILGWLAGQTSRIRLGSAIFQMPGRSAAMTKAFALWLFRNHHAEAIAVAGGHFRSARLFGGHVFEELAHYEFVAAECLGKVE